MLQIMDYTPELPQHLIDRLAMDSDDADDFCPELPPGLRPSTPDIPDEADDFCPQLPPHLLPGNTTNINEGLDGDEFCPQLPPHLKLMPSFNKNDLKKRKSKGSLSSAEPHPEDEFCPALPPHLRNKKSSSRPRVLGPTLPKDYHPPSPSSAVSNHVSTDSSSEDDAEPGQVYGPLPASKPVDMDRYIEETIEKRTKAMQDKISGKVCE